MNFIGALDQSPSQVYDRPVSFKHTIDQRAAIESALKGLGIGAETFEIPTNRTRAADRTSLISGKEKRMRRHSTNVSRGLITDF